MTVVADHDEGGKVVWAAQGKNAATVQAFYDQLGEADCQQLQAVWMDLGAAFKKATDSKAPQARQCLDPFHLIALANEAITKARRWAWNIERDKAKTLPRRGRGRPAHDSPPPPPNQARWVKHTRWALLKDPEHLKPSQLDVLHELRRSNSVLYRCWQLKEGLRDLYRLADPSDAPAHWAGGWPGPAAAGPPHSSRWPRPSGPTARQSWRPSNSAYRTASSKASTARSGSSTTVATATTAPLPSPP